MQVELTRLNNISRMRAGCNRKKILGVKAFQASCGRLWVNPRAPNEAEQITLFNRITCPFLYFPGLPVLLVLLGPQVDRRQFDDNMRVGEYYVSHDQPGQAISEFEAALKAQPQNPQVLYNLGVALRLWGDQVGAEAALRSALRFQPNFPEAHLALGLVLGDSPGNEQLGLTEFELAAAQNPSYAEAYYNIGMIHWKTNNLEQAVDSFRKAAELRPEFAQFRLKHGEALMRAGKLKDAEHELESAVKLDPTNRIASYELGLIEARTGEKEKAAGRMDIIRRVQGSAAEMPERSQLDYNEGLQALERGDTERAILKLNEALEGTRKEALVRTALGIAYERKGDLLAARAELEKVIQADRRSIDGHLNLGVVFMREGNAPKAEQEFQTVLALDPGFAEAYYNLGLTKAAQKDWAHAAELLRQATRLNPHEARAYLALARVLRDSGDTKASLQYYRVACQLDPLWVEAKLEYGSVLLAQRMIHDAIAILSDALKRDPTNRELFERLVAALDQAGLSDQAETERRKFTFFTSGDRPGPPSEYEQGINYLRHGEFDKAVASFEGVLKKGPDYSQVRVKLAFTHFARGNYQGAALEYRKLVALEPQDADLRLNLGIALLRAGNTDDAKKEFLQALDLNPNSATAHYQLGLVYLTENDRTRAMTQFHQARRIDPRIRPPGR
jgi:tetratricopeptide (TPR) repeat protein